MTGMVMDAGHTLNHQRHPRQRPEIRVEAVGPRSLPQRPLHVPELPQVELWFAARLFAAVFELLKIAARTNACRHSSSMVHAALAVTIFREVVTVLCEVQ